jgi:hypothetical protein
LALKSAAPFIWKKSNFNNQNLHGRKKKRSLGYKEKKAVGPLIHSVLCSGSDGFMPWFVRRDH